MEGSVESQDGLINMESEACVIKSEPSETSLNSTLSYNDTNSSWNSESDNSRSGLTDIDPFEGIIYRTHTQQSKLSIEFVSASFFITFKEKIHADYMNSVDIDRTSFVSKCTTHIKGAKCELKLDSHFRTVELCGLGYQMWRNERFPQITRALFRRILKDLDSQLDNFSQFEPSIEDGTDICSSIYLQHPCRVRRCWVRFNIIAQYVKAILS